MRIMVFDVAAESRGALSILNEFFESAIKSDENINWIFVLSKPNYKDTDKVKCIRYPWIKQSWFHRLYFDYFIAPKLVKKNNIDEILSLQNILIPRVKGCKQTIYIHQSLPFVKYKFRFTENIQLWIYQNIIGYMIVQSIKKADNIIVQTNWMKRACIEKSRVDINKIEVKPPKIDIMINKFFELTELSCKTFFYPAGDSYYKNHRVIVEACEELKSSGYTNYKVIFTLTGLENKHIKELQKRSTDNDLPISFVGMLSRDDVFSYYSRSVLIFPSYIESYPLPLLEGKLHNELIITSDSDFSKEILVDYDNAFYFDPFNSEELKKIMSNVISLF